MSQTQRDMEEAEALWWNLDGGIMATRNESINKIAAALAARERETVERCCKDICALCADGEPVFDDVSGKWWHTLNTRTGEGTSHWKCEAAALRKAGRG